MEGVGAISNPVLPPLFGGGGKLSEPRKPVCDGCGSYFAVARITATNMEGLVLDVQELCADCARSGLTVNLCGLEDKEECVQ